jgi:hypothetical protein
MDKQSFFTYHKGYNGRLTAFYAGSIVTYSLKQFNALNDVILTISGVDYRIHANECIKI